MAHGTHVMIIAPQDLIRNGLAVLLNRPSSGIHLVGSYRDLETGEAKLGEESVDILLLDDTLPPTESVVDILTRLRRRFPTMGIIVLSARLNRRYLQMLFGAGAAGYIYREDRLEESLLPGIEAVTQGYYYTSPRASGLLIASNTASLSVTLNSTDLEVLELIGAGLAIKDIARMLQLKVRTIYRSRSRLRLALGAPTNELLVAAALERGLLTTHGQRTARKPNSSPIGDK